MRVTLLDGFGLVSQFVGHSDSAHVYALKFTGLNTDTPTLASTVTYSLPLP
jgi:hypothetical protein